MHHVHKGGGSPHKHSCARKSRGPYSHASFAKKPATAAGVRSRGGWGARPGRTWLLAPRRAACPAMGSSAWSAACKLHTTKSSPSKIRPKRDACWERGEARTHGSLCGKESGLPHGWLLSVAASAGRGPLRTSQGAEQSRSGDGVLVSCPCSPLNTAPHVFGK